MKTTTRKQRKPTTPGFAIEIRDYTDLGLAMMIAEDEEGHSQPIAVVTSINEGREIAQNDLHRRIKDLERGVDPGLCPYSYKVWARGIDGDYRLVQEIKPL